MLYSLARVDEGKLEAIRGLEKKLGKPVLAFSGYRAEPVKLSEAELAELKEAEKKTGLCLVAVAT